jgi:hypothetical protein
MGDPLISRAQALELIKGKSFVVGYPADGRNVEATAKLTKKCGMKKRNSRGKWIPWGDGYAFLGLSVNARARRAVHMCMYAHGAVDTLQAAANLLATAIHVQRQNYYKRLGYFTPEVAFDDTKYNYAQFT